MIRFAIFAAVSSKPQAAEDKISIPQQIELCRKDGLSRGWRETSGPFIIPGETRTRWVNLRDAETSLPPLKHMLDSAQAGDFDLLILYHYNRLRELLDPVDKTLQAYGVQMTSHTAWTDPQPPHLYDPLSDVGKTIRFAQGFTSNAEITELRRRYKQNMPGRILKGLHNTRPPFGYRKPPGHQYDRQAVPVHHPINAPIVLRLKDLFLNGFSLWQIANLFNAESIPAPGGGQWSDVAVRGILKNTYYSGTITFGKTRRTTDPRTGQIKIVPNAPERILTAKGLHTPLWDQTTQARIDEEFQKRGKKYSGIRTQRLSHLLYCGVCGSRVWVQYPGGYYNDHGRRWACSVDPSHVTRKDSELLPAFIVELQSTLQHAQDAPLPDPSSPVIDYTPTITELETRLARLKEAYLSGVIELPEYTLEKSKLDTDLKAAHKKQTANQTQTTARATRLALIGGFQGILQKIPAYITTAPAQEVNTQLRQFINKIIITPTTITIQLIE